MAMDAKHAIVTGGGSGVGASIAVALANAGHRVTISGRQIEPLQQVAALHNSIYPVVADAGEMAATVKLIETATSRHGAPSILIANAGAAESKPFAIMTEADFTAMWRANLMTTFNLWHAGLGPLRAGGWGRMIAIASTAGLKGYPYVSGYAAAKHAVVGLTRALAQELGRTGITVNALCPGFTDTPMLERSVDNIVAKTGRSKAEARASLVAGNPQQRFIRPDEIAATVLWLCGSHSDSINGQAIPISGGEI